MWPLSGREVAEVCGVQDIPRSVEGLAVSGAFLEDDPSVAGGLFIALREGDFDGHVHVEAALRAGAAVAIVSAEWAERERLAPELQARCLFVPDPLVAFRDLAAYLRRRFPFPVVAVGGSNGKTTTKDMLAALLSGPGRTVTCTLDTMNGWTGIPATLAQKAHVRSAPPDALVVEIGIDTVGAMREHARIVAPDVALITMLGAEHTAGLLDLETVVSEELQLFTSAAIRVFHVSDPKIREHLADARAGDVLVGRSEDLDAAGVPAHVGALRYAIADGSPMRSVVELSWKPAGGTAPAEAWRFDVPMAGAHNGQNLACAVAVGLALGRSVDELATGLESFAPPAMRCEVSELPNGVLLVDDAYNANPSSMRAALELVARPTWADRPKVAILGDMLDLGDLSERHHLELCDPIAELVEKGARVGLFGSAMHVVHRALAARGLVTTHLPTDADPSAFADAAFPADAVVLVKASRGMHLERIVSAILGRAARLSDIEPSQYYGRFESVGVTGTNGKTTTTSLVAAIVEAAGETSCRVTTLGAWFGEERVEVEPSGDAFARTLGRAAERGVRTLAIEMTSHALAHGFSKTWPTRIAVFTNLSRDHLDYHGTPEKYLAAKAQLFMDLPPDGVAIFNVGDPASALLDEVTPPGVRRLGYAASACAPECAAIPIALLADAITVDEDGSHATLAPSPIADALGGRLDLQLVGPAHVENALAAALAGHALGHPGAMIRRGLSTFAGVPGRFEIVHRRPLVVVDYAHTPDALERTLAVARSLVARRGGRVLVVFGCGGDRDPGKREEMGGIAANRADAIFLTSDNPRTEDPDAIADAVEAGTRGGLASVARMMDRANAIAAAVETASETDVVVIAGKGHEKEQVLADRVLPFDDVEIARGAALKRGGLG